MTARNGKIILACLAALFVAFIAAGIGVISGRPSADRPSAAAASDRTRDEQQPGSVSRAMTFTQPQAPAETTAPPSARAPTP